MKWADREYQTCMILSVSPPVNPLSQEADLEKLANWIFTEGLLDAEITNELRRLTYVGLAVTVG